MVESHGNYGVCGGEFNSGGSLIEKKKKKEYELWSLKSSVGIPLLPLSKCASVGKSFIYSSNPQLLICRVRMNIATLLDFVKTR